MQGILAGQSWTQETGMNGWELTIVIVAVLAFLGFFYWLVTR